jgi:hypothetical protein
VTALAPSWGEPIRQRGSVYPLPSRCLKELFPMAFQFLTSVPALPDEDWRERHKPEIEGLFHPRVDSDRWTHETVPGRNG